jgi:hypothetical protein
MRPSRNLTGAIPGRWPEFAIRFHSLIEGSVQLRRLIAFEEVTENTPTLTKWVFDPSRHTAGRLPQLERLTRQAGRRLGARSGKDPLDFWLNHLFVYLWRHEYGHGTGILSREKHGVFHKPRVLTGVVEVSERFSQWLSNSASGTIRALMTDDQSETRAWASMPLAAQSDRRAVLKDSDGLRLNRRREARQNIIVALQSFGIDPGRWPRYVQRPDWPENRQMFQLKAFLPPYFEGLHQSPDEWKKKTRTAFEKYLDEQIGKLEFWIAANVETRSEGRFRGLGKTGRNIDIEQRYRWAAQRLTGIAWTKIAEQSLARTSTVTKAATAVLRAAGWPTKLRRIRTGP